MTSASPCSTWALYFLNCLFEESRLRRRFRSSRSMVRGSRSSAETLEIGHLNEIPGDVIKRSWGNPGWSRRESLTAWGLQAPDSRNILEPSEARPTAEGRMMSPTQLTKEVRQLTRVANNAKKPRQRFEGIASRKHLKGRNSKKTTAGAVCVSWKGLAMNALGTKLLAVSLVGILALPTGYCHDQIASPASPATHCCQRNDQQSQIPATATMSCCCQERLNPSQATKVRKHSLAEFPSFLRGTELNASAQFGRTVYLSMPVPLPLFKHSVQATLCVWRL